MTRNFPERSARVGSAGHTVNVTNRPWLTAGKPETRPYKAMFFLGKSEIGLPSDVVVAVTAP